MWRMAAMVLLLTTTSGNVSAADVELVYLANEAYLVDDGKRAVLIDAFVPRPYKVYEPLAPATWQAMLQSTPPFDRVVAAVVTHHHADHFQAEAAAAFLAAHPDVLLYGPPSITGPMREAGYEGHQLVTALPEYGERERIELDGIDIELLRLRHKPLRDDDVPHLGVLLEVDEVRVLHLGDAYPDRENFAPFELASAALTLAIVPDWFFATQWFPAGPRLVTELIAPACTLATHVVRDGRDAALASLQAEFPELLLLHEQGATLNIAGCAQ